MRVWSALNCFSVAVMWVSFTATSSAFAAGTTAVERSGADSELRLLRPPSLLGPLNPIQIADKQPKNDDRDAKRKIHADYLANNEEPKNQDQNKNDAGSAGAEDSRQPSNAADWTPAPSHGTQVDQPATSSAGSPSAEPPSAGSPSAEPPSAKPANKDLQKANAPSEAATSSDQTPCDTATISLLEQCKEKCCPAVQQGDPDAGFDGSPAAGYTDGLLYLRDRADQVRLFLGARLHLDSRHFAGPGVSDSNLTSSLMMRRATLRARGEILSHWQWELEIDFAPAKPSKPKQSPNFRAKPFGAFVNYRFTEALNLQMGQFVVPFMAGNITSSNSTPMLERELAVRLMGAPYNFDVGLQLWGNLPKNKLFWSASVLQGDGDNRFGIDYRPIFTTRVYTRPLADKKSELSRLQFGASFKYGTHDPSKVTYDFRSMTTHNGHTFWPATYKEKMADGKEGIWHVIPADRQLAVAAELRLALGRFDLRSEYVYVNYQTREALEGPENKNLDKPEKDRFGAMKGHAYHVTWAYWILGKPFSSGNPGDRKPKRLNLKKGSENLTSHGLELLVRWEQLFARYEGASRSDNAKESNKDGDIRANVATFGVNYWTMGHMRFSFNYGINMFPKASKTPSAQQRAQVLGGDHLHEFSTRVGISF